VLNSRKVNRTVATLIVSLAGMITTPAAQARDLFFYLGYDTVQVIDGSSDSVIADIAVPGSLRDGVPSPDGKFLYVTADRHRLYTIDTPSLKVVRVVDFSGGRQDRFIIGFDVSADGKKAYAGMITRRAGRGEVQVDEQVVAEIDLATGKILRSVIVPWASLAIVATRGGDRVLAIGQDLIEIDTRGPDLKVVKVEQVLEQGKNALPGWLYPEGKGGEVLAPYYSENGLGFIRINSATGQVTDLTTNSWAMIYGAVIAPDGNTAYGAMDDLYVFDLAAAKVTQEAVMHGGTNFAIGISSDGRKVYTSGGGPTTVVWDAATLKPIKTLQMKTDGWLLRKVVL
jgi:DNA-binding beta-propeller fold protein YncE